MLPRAKLPQDPRDVETNASIAEHRKQVKENAASAAASKSRHGTDCETGPRHDDFGRECDRYICNGPRDTESRSYRRGPLYDHRAVLTTVDCKRNGSAHDLTWLGHRSPLK